MKKNTLTIKSFSMASVEICDDYHLEKNQLQIPNQPLFDLDYRLKNFSVRLIDPHKCHFKINTIMDVMPVSTKVLGEIGNGLSHTLTGVSVILTGADETGIQLHEFGSSNGYLDEKIRFGKSGTPSIDDKIILINVVLKKEFEFNRKISEMIFYTVDKFLQPIRTQLKMINGKDASETFVYTEKRHYDKPKVAIVKEIAGQGAMYDNILFSKEPSGIKKGISIIDMNNMPVLLTANEYRDGVIHALV